MHAPEAHAVTRARSIVESEAEPFKAFVRRRHALGLIAAWNVMREDTRWWITDHRWPVGLLWASGGAAFTVPVGAPFLAKVSGVGLNGIYFRPVGYGRMMRELYWQFRASNRALRQAAPDTYALYVDDVKAVSFKRSK